MSRSVCFMELNTPISGTYILIVIICYLGECFLCQYVISFFVSSNFGLKTTFVDMSMTTSTCFQIPLTLNSFLYFHLNSMCVFSGKACFLQATISWVVFFNLIFH